MDKKTPYSVMSLHSSRDWPTWGGEGIKKNTDRQAHVQKIYDASGGLSSLMEES